MPLTKDEVTESFKIKNTSKDLVEEEQRRTELLQECLQVIPQTEEVETVQEKELIDNEIPMKSEIDLEEEKSNVARIFTTISSEIAQEAIYSESARVTPDSRENKDSKLAETVVKSIVEDIIADTEDSLFWQFPVEPERTYIKGKVYDFDEKKHGTRMTKQFLKELCKKNKLYQTPHLNNVLYLHFKGFSFIENLEEYTGLKCLWLQNNGIREIANLENQSNLRCLQLHNNVINRIENLERLTMLDTLNLSHNVIRRIENLDCLKSLSSLNLAYNYLQETADIEHLRLLNSVSVLDISHNRINTVDVVNILASMENLRVVHFIGNPALKTITLYRKTMIMNCKNLTYLDDRPVSPRERACTIAWMNGGVNAEEAERIRWIKAKQKKLNDSVQALINKRNLYKPVGTSEKEAEDKKKTKEDDEEVATTLVCTSNELGAPIYYLIIHHLHLEKKKKSVVSSSSGSSASSSSDEEVENDGTGKKGAEKSDGRRPMAEEERKATGATAGELLLPWRTEVKIFLQRSPKLVEEITETKKEYVADDAELTEDPPCSHVLETRLSHLDRIVPQTTNETEMAPESCTSEPKIDDTDEKRISFANTGVSCDISNREDNKTTNTKVTDMAEEESPYKDVSYDYRRKDDRHHLSTQLSSIREGMKEFCADMDKFVEDNKIVYENGDVKRFWGVGNVNSPLVHEGKPDGKQSSAPNEGNGDFKWWSTTERKLKVTECMRKREEEADDHTFSKSSMTENKGDTSSGVFHSLLNELDHRNRRNSKQSLKSHSSHKLLAIEETEETVEETVREPNQLNKCGSTLSNTSKSGTNQGILKMEPVRVEIAEAGPNDVGSSNSSEDDESDKESVITVIDLYDRHRLKSRSANTSATFSLESKPQGSSELSESVAVQNHDNENSGSDTQALVAPLTSLHDEKSSQTAKTRKRMHDSENLEMASKKSHLIEEVDVESERVSVNRRSGSEVSERCRDHVTKEAKKFMQKESPLIERCIESLITNRLEGSWKFGDQDRQDFFGCTAMSFTSSSVLNTSERFPKIESTETQSRETASVSNDADILRDLIEETEAIGMSDKLQGKHNLDLYKDFYKHCERLTRKSKVPIKPDFMKNNRIDPTEKKRDGLSSRETKQSKKKQTSKLIEVISENLDAIPEPEEPPADPDEPAMDPALRDRILRSINAPKSEEQKERGKRSAEKLMRTSREAMAMGKSLLQEPSIMCNQQRQPDDSRKFFMNLLKEDVEQEARGVDSVDERNNGLDVKTEKVQIETSQDEIAKLEKTTEVPYSPADGMGKRENGVSDAKEEHRGRIKKSLEMQVIQEN
ncbi:Dynein assembly factor 1, axonemal [Dufourea novaeangliae]|uniref:Dynein axonemal assembly factor 1 homolog n=1 Tax=Dufourea novaeangliae TaxID=178035 RepID=A0A154P184_DUFNO|nr:Dynein assembly factor 1, axonemal [Dufourea novaeangliae]